MNATHAQMAVTALVAVAGFATMCGARAAAAPSSSPVGSPVVAEIGRAHV